MGNFTVTLPYNFVNGTTADANEVNANFNANRDGHNNSVNATTGHGHTGATGDGPLIGATGLDLTANYTWTGTHTFDPAKLTVKGAGAGKAALQYANSATNRTFTIPDPGANDSFVTLTATQTLTNKTITSPSIGGTVSGGATYTSPTINTGTITVNTVDPPNSDARVSAQSLGKGFVFCNSLGTILSSYNIASVSKIATGHYQVVMDRNFTSANTGVLLGTGFTGVTGEPWDVDGYSTDGETYDIYTTRGSTGTNANNSFYLGFMGRLS